MPVASQAIAPKVQSRRTEEGEIRPDLGTADGIAAYRRELRGIAQPMRYAGLFIVTLGAILMIAYGRGPQGLTDNAGGILALVLEGLGWPMLVAVIILRTRHHKARMAEPPGRDNA